MDITSKISYFRPLDEFVFTFFPLNSGRFDFHVKLPAPAAAERTAMLKHEIQKRSLHCSDDVLLDIASKCDGYDAYDLVWLVQNFTNT